MESITKAFVEYLINKFVNKTIDRTKNRNLERILNESEDKVAFDVITKLITYHFNLNIVRYCNQNHLISKIDRCDLRISEIEAKSSFELYLLKNYGEYVLFDYSQETFDNEAYNFFNSKEGKEYFKKYISINDIVFYEIEEEEEEYIEDEQDNKENN
ncbi:hypothetical protein M9Y10_014469 [Tritrichomonas musculus]|uniref:Uncharacterized protein n=1 Tax=Tritrichomonas musculus TaxID=1915356 RepID=A0ABR2KZK3_9EUKA